MADLCSVAAVKRQLNIGATGTANVIDDDLIAVYVTDASKLIETECARTFSATVGTYLYDVGYPVTEGRKLYFRDDMLGVDYLVNGANGTLTSAHYRLLPLDTSPKYALQLLDSAGMEWQIGNDGYRQNAILLVGTAGFCLTGTLPADISLSTTKLAAWLYQHRDDTGDSIQMADGSVVIPSNAPQFVLRTLSRYVRRASYVGGDHR